jgi:hypothetical protein
VGSIKVMEPQALPIYSWGDGVGDVRYFTPQILMPSEIEKFSNATGYMPQAYDFEGAIKALELTMKDAKPGIYFAGNPLEGTYGKWMVAMKATKGWKQVPGCALNRVWGQWQSWKGPGTKLAGAENNATYKLPWYSSDGQSKWIHAFYYIVEGRKEAIQWDFTAKTRNLNPGPRGGDVDLTQGQLGSLWHINYGGSAKVHRKYNQGQAFCPNFGRLSKSCGVAMGYGLPECGEYLDEEFFTIASQELDKKWPKGWEPFLEYGGHSWATNLAKLPSTAQMVCPHEMKL